MKFFEVIRGGQNCSLKEIRPQLRSVRNRPNPFVLLAGSDRAMAKKVSAW